MRKQYYLFIVLVLLNTLLYKTHAAELDYEEESQVPNKLAEDTAQVMAGIDGQGMRMRRSDGESSLENHEDSLNALAEEGTDAKLDDSRVELIKRRRRSLNHAQNLVDNNKIRRKRRGTAILKTHPGLKKRNSSKEKVHHKSELEANEEDQIENRKMKRKAKDEVKRIKEKLAKKRCSKKVKKHVGARCTEPCDSCQTTTEEFTLPTTTESECCTTKCKAPTTRCTKATTPCNMCDTCKDEEQPKEQKEE